MAAQQQAPTSQQGDETILEEAKNLFVQGKRFMALGDCQSATDCLEQSCQLFDAFYGVAKRECADAYFEYGLALVALANLEAGSGTDKLLKRAGIEEEEGEEDEEDDDKNKGDQENGEQGQDDEEGEEDEDEGDDEEQEDGEANGAEVQAENGDKQNATNGTHEVPMEASSSFEVQPTAGTSSGDNKPDGEATEEDEEATTIEIAWEVLCLAKRLFMTDESLDGRLKLAETLQKIGEISIEWDNNDNAVSILEECLAIREAILKPDDRLLALTHYHLGLAHSFKSETQEANDHFQKAISVIEQRIESLSKDLEKANTGQDTVAAGAYQKEINELKELLPDMTMRLDDSKEDPEKATDAFKRTREETQLEDEEAKKVCLDKSKPVDDISHLVKRKAN